MPPVGDRPSWAVLAVEAGDKAGDAVRCAAQALLEGLHSAGCEAAAWRDPRELGSVRGACFLLGWTPEWLREHAAALDPRRTVLINLEPVEAALGPQATPAQAAWLAELGHWVVADIRAESLRCLQSLPDGAWHGGTSGGALRAVHLPLADAAGFAAALPQLQALLAAMPPREALPIDTLIDRELWALAAWPPPAEERPQPVQLVQKNPQPGIRGWVVVAALAALSIASLWHAAGR